MDYGEAEGEGNRIKDRKMEGLQVIDHHMLTWIAKVQQTSEVQSVDDMRLQWMQVKGTHSTEGNTDQECRRSYKVTLQKEAEDQFQKFQKDETSQMN